MIEPEGFAAALQAAGVTLVVGVPDSCLAPLLVVLADRFGSDGHVVAVNEGTAIALAAGHHFGSGTVPLVYLQNSGLGNAVNPLLSLADPAVYGIPMVLLVGWRGDPDRQDEPQHVAQGRVTPALLDTMELPWRLLDAGACIEDTYSCVAWAVEAARQRPGPTALLVRRGAFSAIPRGQAPSVAGTEAFTRERAIEAVVGELDHDTVVVVTTGKAGRELYELRLRRRGTGARDLLTVGSMGHASQIALGIARVRKDVPVVCLDGDGAALMHLGGFASIGASECKNLLHLVLNNGAHESVGGQPTLGHVVDFSAIAMACRYHLVSKPVTDWEGLVDAIRAWRHDGGPAFADVHVRGGARRDLGRPRRSPREAGERLRRALVDQA